MTNQTDGDPPMGDDDLEELSFGDEKEPSAGDEKEPSAGDEKEPSAEEEASGGSLPPSDELEAALREATESVEARHADRKGGSGEKSGSAATSGDKVLLEVLSEELQALKREFEALTKENDELKDRHVRLQAEFENFRRRNLKERQEAHNYGHQNIVKDLLPTVDNLERAIAHSGGSDGGDLRGLLQGIELVQRELLGVLGKHGVERIEAARTIFDPSVHEAMGQVVDDSVPANTVLQVLETGYKLRDRMLRASRVMVSRKSEEAPGSAVTLVEGEQEGEQE